MLRLRDIMTTDLITLDPDITLREAMDVLVSKRISGAPVVAGDEVVGVISATDLLQFAASLPGVPTQRELTPDLYDDVGTVDAAIEADPDDDPAGVYFTELWDDVGGTVVERMSVPTTAEWNSLEEHTVSEAMTRAPVHALTPDTLVDGGSGLPAAHEHSPRVGDDRTEAPWGRDDERHHGRGGRWQAHGADVRLRAA